MFTKTSIRKSMLNECGSDRILEWVVTENHLSCKVTSLKYETRRWYKYIYIVYKQRTYIMDTV